MFPKRGPRRFRRTSRDEGTWSIEIPTDADGMLGRQCPAAECSPAYFKVKPGTGITESHDRAYCPYCRRSEDPCEFVTEAQKDYGLRAVEQETIKGLNKMVKRSLHLGATGRRIIGNDFLSLEVSYKPAKVRPVGRPVEEELRRDIRCPKCGLEHAVFGLATWCPDCGADIFPVHVEEEFRVIRRMLDEVENRRAALGARVAARDIENALEDVVSVFEASLKALTRRHLQAQNLGHNEIQEILRRDVGTAFQNVKRACDRYRDLVGVSLCDDAQPNQHDRLDATFQKRHPITHNLGVIDRRYLHQARSGGLEGREVRVLESEVRWAIDQALKILTIAHTRSFPSDP